ncbi:MAG: HIRAN domain-containing protein [Lachnospiraceae bacterium]|nr:HIRAN domain-containing protein [Lachnospiraceae bacterium]
MGKVYFTLTGTNYYYGNEFLEPGMKVKLKKEPKNEHDKEAIRVEVKGFGKIGYVANSPYTVMGDSYSAGRMLGCFKKRAKGKVLHITEKGILCELK